MSLNFNSIHPNNFVTLIISSVIIYGIILNNKIDDNNQDYNYVSNLTKFFNSGFVKILFKVLFNVILFILIIMLTIVITHKSQNPIYFHRYSLKAFLALITLSSIIIINLYLINRLKTIHKFFQYISKLLDRKFNLTIRNNLYSIASIGFLILMCNIFRIITYNVSSPSLENISLLSSSICSDYRSLIPSGSLFVLLFYFSFTSIITNLGNRYKSFFIIIMILISMISVKRAKYVISEFIVYPQTYEAEYMKLNLKNNLNSSINNIHIFRPNWWSGMVPFKITPGTEIGLLNSSVSSNINEMVLCLLNEIQMESIKYGSSLDKHSINNIRITSSIKGAPTDERDLYGQELPPDDSSSIFLDMTTLVYPR